jgi:DNA-binding transcriptional regulator YdaS (Cro superfamily)
MKLEKYLTKNKTKLTEFSKLSKIKISYLSQIKNRQKAPSLKVAIMIEKATNGQVTFKDLII